MKEAAKSEAVLPATKEMALSSGILSELPSIPQRRPLGELTPSGSDTFDFGSNPSSPTVHKAPDSDAADYMNGGFPHDNASTLWQNGETNPPGSMVPGTLLSPDPIPLTAEPAEIPSPPPGRRSVQFARNDMVVETPSHSRNASWDAKDAIGKLRGSAIMSKLKELAALSTTPGPKLPSGPAMSELGSTTSSPTATRQSSRVLGNVDEDSEDDADAEETADEAATEDAAKARKKKRRMRRPRPNAMSTPATPKLTAAETDTPTGNSRLKFMRRNTMPGTTDQRGGMSEGEGRDHLARGRGSLPWMSSRGDDVDEAESPSGRRIGHLRRISVFGSGGGAGGSDGDTPRRPFFTGERASTFGVQKWRQVKNTLKLLRQKKDERFDYYKSAELMAELRAGAPAVLMLASMIQRDEHGNKRIPVLLEQLKVRIRDSTPVQEGDSERHWLFTIDLEYGSGPSRMTWTVKRTIKEILNLHWKYKLTLGNEKYLPSRLDLGARPKQPRFPLSAFPYLRGVRGLDEDEEADQASVRAADETAGEGTGGEGTAAENTMTENEGRPTPRKKRSRMNVLAGRRRPSVFGDFGGSTADVTSSALDPIVARRRYVERQQRMLEKYLREMIRWLMFRADSNRICRFLELSALGVRLAAEGSYHGKECYLHIQSSKGIDFRRVLTPGKVIARHTRKWFLVRQSYIVCVESPENMNIYDVYLVDSKFKIISKKSKLRQITAPKSEEEEIDLTVEPPLEKHHTLKLLTSERKVKLFSRNQHIIRQFEESITEMLKGTSWHLRNRFGSFAPVRTGVHAQWLVDGRDYMWNVSRAINMARDVIYIHDWWLSPELYMRRPACISQKWRLDRLLQRKAREGVKVFVIVYRNVEAAIPIDSEYTKFSLLNLHPNIFVQRSPNQFKKNQFFFAHHEKVCIVDHDVAFVGGIDLCFGRWDCPQHPVADDKPTGFEFQDSPKDAEHCQLFPGKDYSNPRVQDFFRLSEPYEEMYDRSRVPRMPWHDVSMQVVGQPARDLTRHFVQRWNYVRRGRKPTRPTPFLLPPPDYKREDLDALGLSGTCEVQILRSASTWSLGIDDTEVSIQSAYIKMIEDSEHFVYIENQFFISSTETLNNKIVNRIGDAIVARILRAHENDEDWRAVIIIPLMPGFQNEVNDQDGTSIRLILQCQYRSICRGEHSIFGRLRAAGIDPEDYIQFFSLRQWGRIGHNVLTTEQLYVHAKVIIVDDRVALIGSANINERSMLGNRDSECAAIVRDTDMIWSTMAGRPYLVGRFAHTLRLRLMREHLGLDVDEILEEERQAGLDRETEFTSEMDRIYNDEDSDVDPLAESSRRNESGGLADPPLLRRQSSFNHDVDLVESYDGRRSPSVKGKSVERDMRVTDTEKHKRELEGYGVDRWKSAEREGLDQGRDSVIINDSEVLVRSVSPEGRGTLDNPKFEHTSRSPSRVISPDGRAVGNHGAPPMPPFDRRTTEQLGLPRANQLPTLPVLDDTDIGGPPAYLDMANKPTNTPLNPLTMDVQPVAVHKDSMRDPLNQSFYDDIWSKTAENNTKIYRRVFHCMPDSEVTNWAEYKEFKSLARRFKESMDGNRTSDEHDQKPATPPKQAAAGGAGIGAPGPAAAAKAVVTEKITHGKDGGDKPVGHDLDEKATVAAARGTDEHAKPMADPEKRGVLPEEGDASPPGVDGTQRPSGAANKGEARPNSNNSNSRKDRRTTFSTPEKPRSPAPPLPPPPGSAQGNGNGNGDGGSKAAAAGSQRRGRRRAATKSSRRGGGTDEVLGRAEAEELLGHAQGTLVQFPYDWLVVEETNGNWLFQVDQVAPLQIYN
ncbi:phospholipase D [Phialemonium atrogriseum]|uniref:Phospholipase D1 n=1 Tax=Phialemonium atrogriseum TaxID=1093897 RepID=A0AAJ0BT69_9PEZI|nr:phospholipase D [Phialemonium atrogriseum]KAK1762948.1 phospholipase D [Phialemonium atrogriseum]